MQGHFDIARIMRIARKLTALANGEDYRYANGVFAYLFQMFVVQALGSTMALELKTGDVVGKSLSTAYYDLLVLHYNDGRSCGWLTIPAPKLSQQALLVALKRASIEEREVTVRYHEEQAESLEEVQHSLEWRRLVMELNAHVALHDIFWKSGEVLNEELEVPEGPTEADINAWNIIEEQRKSRLALADWDA